MRTRNALNVLLAISILLLPALNTYAAAQKTTQNTVITPVNRSTADNSVSNSRKIERQYYAEAQKALKKKQFHQYQQYLPKLKNYPLLPYLEIQELSDRLMTLPKKEVDRFLAKNNNTLIGERLRNRWLRTLAIKEMWTDYKQYYTPQVGDIELNCLYIQARLETNDQTAFDDIKPLWDTGKPLPKSCDTIFDAWKQAGLLTPELMWSRHTKAVKADEISLATNLAQKMQPAQQARAFLYESVAQNPRLILQTDHFKTDTSESRAIIMLGLEKYAQADAEQALNTWKKFESQGNFTEDELVQIKYSLALQLLLQDRGADSEKIVAATPTLSHPDLLEGLIREAMRQKDWSKSYRWIQRLPDDVKNTDRWKYWQARTMEELNIEEIAGNKPKDFYAGVAATRGFYGFLSSDKLGKEYSLVDKPLPLSSELMKKVELNPGVQRAREFYLLGDISASAQEWRYITRNLPNDEIVAAGRLADKWGWYGQAIQTMADSKSFDELQVRFPLVYREHIKAAARQTSVNEPFIFAITRQESAFSPTATSTAGALGLMQLLPSTAKSTAKKSGLSFKQQDLFLPERNIILGSRYLDELMQRFSGNRILVAAAYNAGPTKVRKWINRPDNEKQDFDVWIETIPYKETRHYVQNILSFSVIYGYRTDKKQPFITGAEAAQKL